MAIKKNQLSFLRKSIVIAIAMMAFNTFAIASRPSCPLRVAILDNFTAEKSSQKYKNDYIAGIITAVSAAKEKGFAINYKTFTYGSKPLDILTSIKEVKEWNPDLIIGPHSSNQFLLMPKYFNDVLVLSPYATDEATTKMPSNFYSLSLPDTYMAKATVAFIGKYFPGKDIFNLTQADCKDCYDMTEIFSTMYKKSIPKQKSRRVIILEMTFKS